MIDLGIRCPDCGASYYAIRYATSTAMYSPTIVKDGKIISDDPNYRTYHCQCIACGKFFSATEQHMGMIENIELTNGFAATGMVPYETAGITVDRARVMADENVIRWKAAAEDLNKALVAGLKSEIATLQMKNN